MSNLLAFRVIAHAFTLTQESVISLRLRRGAISQARVAAPVFVAPEEEREAGPRPASQSGCQFSALGNDRRRCLRRLASASSQAQQRKSRHSGNSYFLHGSPWVRSTV